ADLALVHARGGPPLPRPDPRTAGARPGPPRRDPFAPPGSAGDRWARFGANAPLPPSYRGRWSHALAVLHPLALPPALAPLLPSPLGRRVPVARSPPPGPPSRATRPRSAARPPQPPHGRRRARSENSGRARAGRRGAEDGPFVPAAAGLKRPEPAERVDSRIP